MPTIKCQHVVSCSSEDRIHCAENMLVSDRYRKWKSAQAGEKQISLVIQFEKSSVIHSVDIGNEGSAFVEILVGRSSDTSPDYQVLLVSSSFMTPAESREGSSLNRVRMFGEDKLSQTAAKEKWDLVKIVCTQPFNKTIQYGLSFIAFHSPPEKRPSNDEENVSQSALGSFKIKSSDETENKISVGSWFAKRKSNSQDVDALSTPAAIKSATVTTSDKSSLDITPKRQKLSAIEPNNSDKRVGNGAVVSLQKNEKQKQPDIVQERTKTGTSTSNSRSSFPSTSKSSSDFNKMLPENKSAKSRINVTADYPSTSKGSKLPDSKNSKPRGSDTNKKQRKTSVRPFHKLLEGTVFVLSGYQNPQRGQIRDMALEMGALYKPDWNNQCTHLICAFINTPKFQEVNKKGGRVVKENWILECHKQKKLLPWRQFMLGKSNRPETSESEASDDEKNVPQTKSRIGDKKSPAPKPTSHNRPETSESEDEKNVPQRKSRIGDKKSPAPKPTSCNRPDSDDNQSSPSADITPSKTKYDSDPDADTDVDSARPSKTQPDSDSDAVYAADTDVDSDSGCDTETEIRKVLSNNKATVKKSDTTGMGLPKLPNIFESQHFYVYGNFDDRESKQLVRYIIGCGGIIDDYMNKSVTCVITNSDWNDDFTDAISKNSLLRILNPSWVFDCIGQGRLLHKKDYLVPKR